MRPPAMFVRGSMYYVRCNYMNNVDGWSQDYDWICLMGFDGVIVIYIMVQE